MLSPMDDSICDVIVRDIRFPTTLNGHGSDAVHAPDYSCAYVTVSTDSGLKGYGLAFTLGRGTEIVCHAVRSLSHLVIGKKCEVIFGDFGKFWRSIVDETQLRWLGPEKGVTHLATAGVINALWDLWARMENKPFWKFLVDMEPEKLVSTVDFRYLSDAITKDEAIAILKTGRKGREGREKQLLESGYPAYTTAAGWLGYSDEYVQQRCKVALTQGFKSFKVKVGANQEDDKRRLGLIRRLVGDDKTLMTDANQVWDVQQAIDWMRPLAKYNLLWIEEPTSPDDIMGHKAIAQGLKPYGIGVATGEACHNKVMFKQFLQCGAMQFCQIDSCRLAGPNEIIAVMLMAAKFKVPVCPHAGGVGLCEMVHHWSLFDYCCLSNTMDNRMIEYVDHLHEHFVDPVVVKNGCYVPLKKPGYSTEMKTESLDAYEYPGGSAWQQLFDDGTFNRP